MSDPSPGGEQQQDGFLVSAMGATSSIRDIHVRLRLSSRSGAGTRTWRKPKQTHTAYAPP